MRNKNIIMIIILVLIILLLFMIIYGKKINISENQSKNDNIINNEENKNYIIEKNNSNEYIKVTAKDEDIVLRLFNDFKQELLVIPQLAYDKLDKEYKEAKYKDFEEFSNYIESQKNIIESISLASYKITTFDSYTQYMCVDQYGNYYILNETSPMQYTVILDTYTIDLPQFIEKYDSGKTQEKVILNIERIKQALNSGDYAYVYSKLADSFKSNKYKTQDEFENYMKNTIYENINIEYKKFSNEGETYIYDIEITDNNSESDEVINMQIIMQLKEERNFIMSFSIK